MGKSEQRKGKAGELELVSYFNDRGYTTRRGASRSYGTEPDIIGLPGVHVEVKRVEKPNLSAAMEQAVRDSERFNDGLPVVFHRRNREGWLVSMRLADWIKLYEKENYNMLNKVFIMGLFVRDPELRNTQANIPVTSFTIAVERDSKEKQTDFIDCVAWKNTAEYINTYGAKGRLVVVSGSLQIKEWTDKNGSKRRNAEIIVDDLYFCDKSHSVPATASDDEDSSNLPF